jgi:hypothetical protein
VMTFPACFVRLSWKTMDRDAMDRRHMPRACLGIDSRPDMSDTNLLLIVGAAL